MFEESGVSCVLSGIDDLDAEAAWFIVVLQLAQTEPIYSGYGIDLQETWSSLQIAYLPFPEAYLTHHKAYLHLIKPVYISRKAKFQSRKAYNEPHLVSKK